jgi:glycosyltransferase involved in cell wall biosynthesis
MRIAWILPGGLEPGGVERTIPALAWLLGELTREHDVHVFVLAQSREPRRYLLHGAQVDDLGLAGWPRALRPAAAWWRLSRLAGREERFDVFHGFWVGLPGLLAIRAARRHAVPHVVSLMGTELARLHEGDDVRGGARGLIRLTLRQAHSVTAGSRFLAELARPLGVEAECVPLGIPTSWLDDAPSAAGPPWRLLHVASLNRWKDQHTLFAALADVLAHRADIHLDVVGEDTLGGEAQRDAARLGVAGHVTFHGFLPSSRVERLYARAHMLVVSSRFESQGVVVLEAAAKGVPTVGTAVGLVADGHDDWTVAVPAGSPRELARAIVALLDDPERRQALGARARGWAAAHDVRWTAARFVEVYRAASRSRPPRAPLTNPPRADR